MKIPELPPISSRDDAQASGRARFFTGRPCKHGHMAERFVSNAGCVDCVNRPRRVAPRTANVLRVEIPIYDTIPAGFIVELHGLIHGWVDHVLRERGYRKDIQIDMAEWMKRGS